jgi:rfaE bifunctional protein nucleotidyltransferase chain/domain
MQGDNIYQKILPLDELSKLTQSLKEKGDIIVHCHGVFDLLHPGHVKHFEAAKKEGNILIVTITKDRYVGKGPGRPVFNEQLRAETIAALQSVDYVGVNEWPTAVETIKMIKPDVYVKGNDYSNRESDLTGKIYEEEEAIKSVGGRIHFTDEISFSSTKLLNEHFNVHPKETKEFLRNFCSRYSAENVLKKLQDLEKIKVMLAGDTIIDEYHYCKAMGKSTKDSNIVAKYMNEESFAGGILAAANHLAGFCKDVQLVTCLGGEKHIEEFIRRHLKPNIQVEFFYREDSPTVVKRRFVDPDFLTKMFEINFINDIDLPKETSEKVLTYLEGQVPKYDLIIVGDYGHGFIDENIKNVLCGKAHFLAVNTQTNSANIGFNLITKYPKADYICIDEPEIRFAAHDKFGPMERLIKMISGVVQCDFTIVTLGHRGSIAYDKEKGFFSTPVFSSKVVDRVGAGDAFLAITSPCVRMGFPLELVGFIGNAVGALAVQIVCNRSSIDPPHLYKFIKTLLT